MSKETHYDLVILGSGSTAFAAALSAAAQGKTVLMTEERTVGGTCVNRGCVPSKNLIEAAHIWHDAGHPRFPGLNTRQEHLDFQALIAQKDDTIAALQSKKYMSVAGSSAWIEIKTGHAAFVDAHTIEVAGERATGDQILIATGSRSVIPPLPGLDSVPYLTSDLLTSGEPQELKELPGVLAIVGGGYIALELGQMFSRLGSKVIILEKSEHILSGYEPEVALGLESLLRGEGVDLRTNTAVERVEKSEDGVTVYTSAGTVKATHLLIATGRSPNSDGLNLEAAGVKTDSRGFIRVDENLRTNVPHIWGAGDVIGGQMATPVGAQDGSIVAENAFNGATRRAHQTLVPRAIFTDPQVAVVGLTDTEAVSKGLSCMCRTVSMEHVPRAAAIRDTRGLIKMVAEKESGRIVGVSILAPNAAELIHIAALAIKAGMTVDDVAESIFVYPTFSESIKIAALAFRTDVTKLSCCAEGFTRKPERKQAEKPADDKAAAEPECCEPKKKVGFLRRHLDKLGVAGSAFAALCCLGVPALVSFLSALGLGFLINDAILMPLLAVSLIMTVGGLYLGMKDHGHKLALALGVASALVIFVFIAVAFNKALAVTGILGLVGASLLNIWLKLRRHKG